MKGSQSVINLTISTPVIQSVSKLYELSVIAIVSVPVTQSVSKLDKQSVKAKGIQSIS